jgi:hypothetical protein
VQGLRASRHGPTVNAAAAAILKPIRAAVPMITQSLDRSAKALHRKKFNRQNAGFAQASAPLAATRIPLFEENP